MEISETSIFTRQVDNSLTEVEYRSLQIALLIRPDGGSVIPGSGGLRKLRWGLPGRGKREGIRVIYYLAPTAGRIYLLYLYPKNVRSDLTPTELRVLRKLINDN